MPLFSRTNSIEAYARRCCDKKPRFSAIVKPVHESIEIVNRLLLEDEEDNDFGDASTAFTGLASRTDFADLWTPNETTKHKNDTVDDETAFTDLSSRAEFASAWRKTCQHDTRQDDNLVNDSSTTTTTTTKITGQMQECRQVTHEEEKDRDGSIGDVRQTVQAGSHDMFPFNYLQKYNFRSEILRKEASGDKSRGRTEDSTWDTEYDNTRHDGAEQSIATESSVVSFLTHTTYDDDTAFITLPSSPPVKRRFILSSIIPTRKLNAFGKKWGLKSAETETLVEDLVYLMSSNSSL